MSFLHSLARTLTLSPSNEPANTIENDVATVQTNTFALYTYTVHTIAHMTLYRARFGERNWQWLAAKTRGSGSTKGDRGASLSTTLSSFVGGHFTVSVSRRQSQSAVRYSVGHNNRVLLHKNNTHLSLIQNISAGQNTLHTLVDVIRDRPKLVEYISVNFVL